jgi:hypothetical protein
MKISKWAPLIAPTARKRAASSWAVGVLGPPERHHSQTPARSTPAKSNPSATFPLPAATMTPKNTSSASVKPGASLELFVFLLATCDSSASPGCEAAFRTA